MIYDTLNHWEKYENTHPGVAAGLRFLATADLTTLADGRYDVCDGVFVKVMSYETKAVNSTPERHEEYADIFYLLEGEELVGWCPVEALGAEVKASPEKDVWLHEAEETVKLPLGGGRFLVLFPWDGHAPNIAPNEPGPARKCVVKVRV